MKRVTYKDLITAIITLFLLTLVSIIWIDKPLAIFVNQNFKLIDASIAPVISFIEVIFGFNISKYLFGFVAILIGTFVYIKSRRFPASNLFFFIGLTHIMSRFAAGLLKNVFLRPRPFEWLSGNSSDFFSNGSSFPSAHTAHFFGLFLPIIFLYPKFSWIIILPVFVALSRVIANDHYLGDVIAAIAIALLFTWAFARMFGINSKGKELYIGKPSH